MKYFIPFLVRALAAAIVGVFIIQYREDTVRWITIGSGILFFVSGVITCAIYYSNKRDAEAQQPLDIISINVHFRSFKIS